MTVGNRNTHMSWPTRMRSNAVGGGDSLAWEVAILMPLQAGVLVRKWSQLTPLSWSAKLSELTPGISYCSVESAVQLCTPAYRGLRVSDSRQRPNQTLVSSISLKPPPLCLIYLSKLAMGTCTTPSLCIACYCKGDSQWFGPVGHIWPNHQLGKPGLG